ncbi:YbaK/EbsC family protein [Exilibacterium tricleocarpae]|uniref:YbaK/EbsC family protein n=1 Tax=Exilibacterium tricleocarpae TaxID=2591008 RepID=A0A545U5N3_9GAMM|nr:YbaK/EbsC family protein [Exilibacterium tricleocarpae]TQV84785.1 YbaK/EbsC family protein [Exilibacterium tricleocarpae]
MGIAITLKNYLQANRVAFDLLHHHYAEGSHNTACAARIPSRSLAKAVVFRDEDFYYTLAVIPSDRKVRRHTLNQIFDRHLELADEEELDRLFSDCARGAVPALGQAYGVNVIWDEQLLDVDDIWMQAGDHEHLIHISRRQFEILMETTLREKFSAEAPGPALKKAG